MTPTDQNPQLRQGIYLQRERSQFENPLFYSSHRHLRSETYRTLIQILSACYEHSQVSASQDPTLDICERGELVSPDGLVPDNSRAEKDKVVDENFVATGVERSGFQDELMVIDKIKDMMQTEEDGNFLEQKGLMVGDGYGDEGSDYQGTGVDGQLMLIGELEHIMKGNGEHVEENSISILTTSTGLNQNDDVDASANNREKHLDVQQIAVEECGNKAHLEGLCNTIVSESNGFSLGNRIDCQVSKPSEDIEDRSQLRTFELEVQQEMQQKESELEKVDQIVASNSYVAEDIEVEEGEISGDFEVNDISLDILLDDAVVSEEKKVCEKQISQDIVDQREFGCNKQDKLSGKFCKSTSFIMNHTNSDRALKLKEESVRNETQLKTKSIVHGASLTSMDSDRYKCAPAAEENKSKASLKEGAGYPIGCLTSSPVHGETLVHSAIETQGIASREKLGSGVSKKRKRAPPSQEKKAKKKQKERKKRAEKNRQLGVKRLKLRPVVKPKTIAYCRHYLMGRCHEGDNCKYSHDTVPLTKSKPCGHFARNSCMKGDDCPFDHELSKYPCSNFVDKGFCNRGDNCLFSHKIPPKEDSLSAPSSGKNEVKPPSLLSSPNSQKQPSLDRTSQRNVDGFNSEKVSSSKNKEQNVVETLLKPPALAPKGISCLFVGKSSALESSKINQGNLSPKRNAIGKVGNQSEVSASSTFQNMNETPKKSPATVAAKGVNFLSFGNAPLQYSSGNKLSALLLNSKNSIKSSVVNTDTGHKPASSTYDGENSAKIGHQTTQSVSSSSQMSHETPKMTTPPTHDRKNCFPSSSDNIITRTLQESQNNHYKHQNTSGIQWRLLGSSLASGQSRSTTSSAQKAVECTLAIASKINASTVSNETSNETRGKSSNTNVDTSGDALSDTSKASKILEFLSGFGNKMRQ